jgi:AAT family amino acid transporter/lysine-specific permease
VATYIGVPAFLALWWGYRAVKKSRLINYEDMPFEFPAAVEAERERWVA